MPDNHKQNPVTGYKMLMVATEFGFIIAIPLILLTFLGKWLEQRYDSKIYLIGTIILAVIVSSIMVYRKTIKLYQELNQDEDK